MKRRSTLLALFAVVAVANIVVLGNVMANRRGAFREIELTDGYHVSGANRNRSAIRIHLTTSCNSRTWDSAVFHPKQEAWAVLELDGPASERCRETLSDKILQPSPLVLIDGARSPGELEARYPDRKRYWIVRATAEATGKEPGTIRLYPRLPPMIVPARYRSLFSTRDARPAITIRMGSRYHPWIAAARSAG